MYRLTIIFIWVFGIALGQSALATEKTTSEISEYALIMAGEKRFDDALKIIDAQSDSDKNTYELSFTKARILTWSGDYQNARNLFDSLMREYPNNADVLVSLAYMEFFSGNLDIAERYFNRVIMHNPLYLDAHQGLERVIKTRQNAALVQNTSKREIIKCPSGYKLRVNGYCHRET